MRRMSSAILLVLLAAVFLSLPASENVVAVEFSEWSPPVNLGAMINSVSNEAGAAISKNGLSLFFTSNRPGGFGGQDIWVSQRASLNDPWGPPVNLGAPINTTFNDRVPALSRDGHIMFFTSDRPGGLGAEDLWFAWRAHTRDDFAWHAPVNLGGGPNTGANEAAPSYLENDDSGIPNLFFNSDRPGGIGGFDIYVSAMAADGSFAPAELVAELSSPQGDARPSVRFDGLEIFIHSTRPGFGGQDLWVSTRGTPLDAWSPPVNLGPVINTAANDAHPAISSDRETLFFDSTRLGGFGLGDLYMSTRTRLNP